MLIYAIISRENRTAFRKSRKIISMLKNYDCKLLTGIYPKSIERKSSLISFIQKQMKIARSVDGLVFDAAQYSPVIAFLTANALLNNKFVLFLCEKGHHFEVSNLSDVQNFQMKNYSNFEELEIILKKFLNDSKRKLNKRFILNISNEIEQYLDWVSEEWGINKAEIVRRSILTAIQADKDYQNSIGN